VIDAVKSTRECLLHGLERESCRTQPYTFVEVLEHESVFAFVVTTARTAVSNIVADHRLKLECYMLDDVWRVGAVAEPDDESPSLADAATVFFQARHGGNECFSKSRHVGGGDVFVCTHDEIHSHHRPRRPEICAARGMQRRHPDLDCRIRPYCRRHQLMCLLCCELTDLLENSRNLICENEDEIIVLHIE
jgi:hypothetical protein